MFHFFLTTVLSAGALVYSSHIHKYSWQQRRVNVGVDEKSGSVLRCTELISLPLVVSWNSWGAKLSVHNDHNSSHEDEELFRGCGLLGINRPQLPCISTPLANCLVYPSEFGEEPPQLDLLLRWLIRIKSFPSGETSGSCLVSENEVNLCQRMCRATGKCNVFIYSFRDKICRLYRAPPEELVGVVLPLVATERSAILAGPPVCPDSGMKASSMQADQIERFPVWMLNWDLSHKPTLARIDSGITRTSLTPSRCGIACFSEEKCDLWVLYPGIDAPPRCHLFTFNFHLGAELRLVDVVDTLEPLPHAGVSSGIRGLRHSRQRLSQPTAQGLINGPTLSHFGSGLTPTREEPVVAEGRKRLLQNPPSSNDENSFFPSVPGPVEFLMVHKMAYTYPLEGCCVAASLVVSWQPPYYYEVDYAILSFFLIPLYSPVVPRYLTRSINENWIREVSAVVSSPTATPLGPDGDEFDDCSLSSPQGEPGDVCYCRITEIVLGPLVQVQVYATTKDGVGQSGWTGWQALSHPNSSFKFAWDATYQGEVSLPDGRLDVTHLIMGRITPDLELPKAFVALHLPVGYVKVILRRRVDIAMTEWFDSVESSPRPHMAWASLSLDVDSIDDVAWARFTSREQKALISSESTATWPLHIGDDSCGVGGEGFDEGVSTVGNPIGILVYMGANECVESVTIRWAGTRVPSVVSFEVKVDAAWVSVEALSGVRPCMDDRSDVFILPGDVKSMVQEVRIVGANPCSSEPCENQWWPRLHQVLVERCQDVLDSTEVPLIRMELPREALLVSEFAGIISVPIRGGLVEVVDGETGAMRSYPISNVAIYARAPISPFIWHDQPSVDIQPEPPSTSEAPEEGGTSGQGTPPDDEKKSNTGIVTLIVVGCTVPIAAVAIAYFCYFAPKTRNKLFAMIVRKPNNLESQADKRRPNIAAEDGVAAEVFPPLYSPGGTFHSLLELLDGPIGAQGFPVLDPIHEDDEPSPRSSRSKGSHFSMFGRLRVRSQSNSSTSSPKGSTPGLSSAGSTGGSQKPPSYASGASNASDGFGFDSPKESTHRIQQTSRNRPPPFRLSMAGQAGYERPPSPPPRLLAEARPKRPSRRFGVFQDTNATEEIPPPPISEFPGFESKV
eukprot:GHVN01073363.1.p1 GENE.GHVN01073363.1~~GHVN01073363.1.p1  ORF type:complete len:1127 (+),score=75.63 GHVN01073363.1:2212-5592(+)